MSWLPPIIDETGIKLSDEMSELRARIDVIDDELVAILSRRFSLTGRVGRIKALTGEAPVKPDRQRQQAEWLKELAVRHLIDQKLVLCIYKTIMDEVSARHAHIARSRQEDRP